MKNDNLNERTIKITNGNLKSHHIYITAVRDMLPADVLGGSTKEQESTTKSLVKFNPGPMVETDIPKGRNFFRNRAGIKEFFERANIKENDLIVIKKLGTHRFSIFPADPIG